MHSAANKNGAKEYEFLRAIGERYGGLAADANQYQYINTCAARR
jgi:hypothetical protein